MYQVSQDTARQKNLTWVSEMVGIQASPDDLDRHEGRDRRVTRKSKVSLLNTCCHCGSLLYTAYVQKYVEYTV